MAGLLEKPAGRKESFKNSRQDKKQVTERKKMGVTEHFILS